MLAPWQRQNGVGLIEIMVGLAIVALLFALGLPSFSTYVQNSRIRNAAESIQDGLQLARTEAVRLNTSVQFTLTSGSSWKVECVDATVPGCASVIQSRASAEGSSSAVKVTASNGTPIVFNGLGRMTAPVPAGGASLTSINVDLDPAVLPAAQSRDLRITIDIGGSVRMCDPNASSPDNARAC
ncbi:MAG TPA: GspH/FimT family pseudopilin [Noviherbaspirillum sp.]|nr:GspH/FimT family pseudopilin [Noviherbaspirillum sp.]